MIRKTQSLTRAFGSWYISINLVQVDWYYNKQGVSYSSLDNIFTSSDSRDIWQAFTVLRFATVPGTYVRTYVRYLCSCSLFRNEIHRVWFDSSESKRKKSTYASGSLCCSFVYIVYISSAPLLALQFTEAESISKVSWYKRISFLRRRQDITGTCTLAFCGTEYMRV